MGAACGKKAKPAVEEPVLTKPDEPAKAEPAKEEPAKEEPAKEEAAKEEPAKEEPAAATPTPAAPAAPKPEAKSASPPKAAAASDSDTEAVANDMVNLVIKEAVASAEEAAAAEQATEVVASAVEAALKSVAAEEAAADGNFVRKISGAWAATTEGVGNFFKVLTPRLSSEDVKPPEGLSTAGPTMGAETEGLDTPRGSLVDGTLPEPAPADEVPLIAGFLIKKASGFPFNWLKRYCAFYASTGTLAYYVTEAEAVTRQNIKGQRAKITGCAKFDKEEFGLVFNAAEGKPLWARAASAEEQERWITIISKHFEDKMA